MSLQTSSHRRSATWVCALSCAFMGLYAALETFGPRGFNFRDEIYVLQQAMAFKAGWSWTLTWANGNLLKLAQFELYALSGQWKALHWPLLAALAAQSMALYQVGRRLGGPRVAQGALLASLCSATALVQARSLLPFACLPCYLSLGLVFSLKGPRWAFVAGLCFVAGFLDYEATVFALPGVAALCFFEPKLKQRSALVLGLGATLGLLGILFVSRHSLAEWWSFRMAYNRPFQATVENPLWTRMARFFFGGPNEAYLGVSGHGSFPTWALPLALLGLVLQARRRPWLWLWLLGSLMALAPASAKFEPQRAFSALLPLCLACGFGWAWIWRAARSRRWLALTLLLLPLCGAAFEISAFERSMRQGQGAYQRSQAWLQVASDPVLAGHIDLALMPAGLTWEGLIGPPLVVGKAPLIWLPSDLGADAPTWPGQALRNGDGSLTGDLLLQAPARDALREDLAVLRPFWLRHTSLRGSRLPAIAACRRLLQGRQLQTRLAREAVWDVLLENGIPTRQISAEDLQALDQEGFRSPFFYRVHIAYARAVDLKLARQLGLLLQKHAGTGALQPDERQLLAQP